MTAPRTASAPARVNLLGEHVDHQGGTVLPVAINLRTVVHYSPGDAWEITSENHEPDGDWRRYVDGVLEVLREEGIPLQPGKLSIKSSIPEAKGLSSSAALEVAEELPRRARQLVRERFHEIGAAGRIRHGARVALVQQDRERVACEAAPVSAGRPDHAIVGGGRDRVADENPDERVPGEKSSDGRTECCTEIDCETVCRKCRHALACDRQVGEQRCGCGPVEL